MTGFTSVIRIDELASRFEGAAISIIDCRFDLKAPDTGQKAWREERIPGAVYAHLDEDLAGPVSPDTGRHPLPEPTALAARFRAMGVRQGSQVVVYDASGGAIAARAWWLFRWLGHTQVAVLDGGYEHWINAGLPLDRGTPEAPTPGDFQRTDPVLGETLSTAVLAGIAEEDRERLIDARDSARFRGEVEPIDPVPGHVPGAVNLPFANLLDDDGCFRSRGQIRRILEKRLSGDLDSPWTVMCGSGVTACHLAAGAEYAGLRPPVLYVGSFSEWIRDPARKVATSADGQGQSA